MKNVRTPPGGGFFRLTLYVRLSLHVQTIIVTGEFHIVNHHIP